MAESDRNNHIAIEDLSAYADEEIETPAERERIEQHLETCASCRQELAELRAIQDLLSEMPEPEVPRSFRLSPADVEDGSRGPAPAPIQPWLLRHQSAFRVAAMAAAVLLALVVTIDLLPGRSETAEDAALDRDTMGESQQELAREEAAQEEAQDDAGGAGYESGDIDEGNTDEQEAGGEESAASGSSDGADEAAEEEEEADETAPQADQDDAAPESAGDVDKSEEDAARDSAAQTPDDVQDATEPEGDESSPATQDAPMSGDDAEVASESESQAGEEALRVQEGPANGDSEDGLTTLRVVAIVLAVLTVALAGAGFLLPRWWRSSSRP